MKTNWFYGWPPGTPKFFVVDCRSGLGNRIKALVAGRRLAQKMPKRHFGVVWAQDGYHCHCPLEFLFTSPFLQLSEEFFHSTGRIRHYQVLTKGPNYVDRASLADVIWVTEENFFYGCHEQGTMWGQHGPDKMANSQIRDELLAQFDALVPHHQVARQVQRFAQEYFLDRPVVGVHVRRGDNLWANTHVPTRLFPRVIDQYMGDDLLFLCSDSPETIDCLRARYGSRILTYPVRSLDRGSSWEAVQDALIQIYLLAKTRLIVRTPSSTFSQCAAWLGRVPTVEVGPLEHGW